MWYSGNVILIMNSCGYSYGTRTSAESGTFEQSISQFFVYILTSMSCNVDILRVEFSQYINVMV